MDGISKDNQEMRMIKFGARGGGDKKLAMRKEKGRESARGRKCTGVKKGEKERRGVPAE